VCSSDLRKNLRHCLESAGVERILTSRALVSRLLSQGVELDAFSDRFVHLEDIGARLGPRAKLGAWLRSRLSWRELRRARPPETAAVLFTSGSETVPKAVPLTHRNILTNVHDCFDLFHVRANESILGILPPFHSFGLTTSVVLPLVLGGRVVQYPNPTDGAALGRMTEAYRPTMLVTQHGSDSHLLDPLAHMRLSTTAMSRAARMLDGLAHEHAGGRWLATGGGGYDVYRVVPRAWGLVWLAQAHRDVPAATPAEWRTRWAAEAARHGQGPLPDTMLDPPDVVSVEPHQVADRNLAAARTALAYALRALGGSGGG
jgi:hypothetical protein